MEWFLLLVFLFWDQISSLLGLGSDEDEDDSEDTVDEVEDEKVENVKEESQYIPTVTRVSKNDLRNKFIDRPTVWRRKR